MQASSHVFLDRSAYADAQWFWYREHYKNEYGLSIVDIIKNRIEEYTDPKVISSPWWVF